MDIYWWLCQPYKVLLLHKKQAFPTQKPSIIPILISKVEVHSESIPPSLASTHKHPSTSHNKFFTFKPSHIMYLPLVIFCPWINKNIFRHWINLATKIKVLDSFFSFFLTKGLRFLLGTNNKMCCFLCVLWLSFIVHFEVVFLTTF